MTNNELKSTIWDLRSENKSYREIKEILATKYGITRSQQAIQGMYARMLKKEEDKNSKTNNSVICDVMNIYALGYNMSQVYDMLSNKGLGISYYNIQTIIKNNSNYYHQINSAMIATITDLMRGGDTTLQTIRARLSYNGVQITEKKLIELVRAAANIRMDEECMRIINRSYNVTRSLNLVKDLCSDKNLSRNAFISYRKEFENT